MRFPPKSCNKELESAEDRREREAQVDPIFNSGGILRMRRRSPEILSYLCSPSLLILFFQDLELAKEMAEEDDDAY